MLIKKLILENYGLYADKTVFDLAPKVNGNGAFKPIVLFGGNNGAGKTTLLDAVRLIFYGKTVLGNRVSKKEYSKYLTHQIHRNSIGVPNNYPAILGIEFEHVFLGNTDNYYVERSWKKSNGFSEETLKIVRNGSEVENVTDDYWRGFIEEVIPERLSQLFFFDGEKIKSIADDQTSSNALGESIKSLLGLDIIERLRSDLNTYHSREIKNLSSETDQEKAVEIDKKIEEVKRKIETLQENKKSLKDEVTEKLADISELEIKLDQEGANFSFQRNAEKGQKEALTARYQDLKKNVLEECEKTFPFALCPSITNKLSEQIKLEKAHRDNKTIRSAFNSFEKDINSLLQQQGSDSLQDEVQSIFKKHYEATAVREGFEEILGLSNSEETQLLHWVEDGLGRSNAQIRKYGKQIIETEERLQKIEQILGQAPPESSLKQYFEEIKHHNKSIGSAEQQIKQIEKEISGKNNFISQLLRDKSNIEKKYSNEAAARDRLKLSKKAKQALIDYSTILTKRKIDQLRLKVADCFNHLSRKGNFIQEIYIDPTTFDVKLIAHNGDTVPKEKLSAGEKQIFAIALLWGLAETAERPLPVIIDTPLGRLDSEHRDNLINKYFPNASHQVILLSTDTEFDKKLYDKLLPSISHCYHLDYSKTERKTTAQKGYFWQ